MTPLSAEVEAALEEADEAATWETYKHELNVLAAEVRRLHARVREEQERRLLADDTLLRAQNNAIKFMQEAKELRAELEQARSEIESWKRQSRANWEAARELTTHALKP